MQHIAETPVRNQAALSPTLVKYQNEEKEQVCVDCQVVFTATIWYRADGTPVKPQERCPGCKDKHDIETAKAQLQEKLKESILHQEEVWWDTCPMPTKFALKTFNEFDSAAQPKAFKAIKGLDWKGLDTIGKSLVLLSPGVYGLGKTHLVCALINHIIETEDKAVIHNGINGQYISRMPCPVYFTSENTIIHRIRQSYNRNPERHSETEDDIYKNLSKYQLLIVDDVGKVRPKDLNFLQGVYFNILDERYSENKAIILTTNLDFTELEHHIGGASADRLREMAGKDGFIKMTGKSYRHQ